MTSSSAFSCCLFVLLIGLVHSAPSVEPTSFECPENEYFVNCSLAVCQKTCRDFLVPPPCPGISSDCYQPACVCGEGYLRSDSGVCVPYRQCEPSCLENEEFTNCTYNVCRPNHCFQKGFTLECNKVEEEYCLPGCVCKENFLMQNGVCVPEDQCKNEREPIEIMFD